MSPHRRNGTHRLNLSIQVQTPSEKEAVTQKLFCCPEIRFREVVFVHSSRTHFPYLYYNRSDASRFPKI